MQGAGGSHVTANSNSKAATGKFVPCSSVYIGRILFYLSWLGDLDVNRSITIKTGSLICTYKNCNAYALSIELLNLKFSVSFFDAEKGIKPAKDVQNVKDTSANAVHPSSSFTDAEKFVEEILDRISAKLLSDVCE